jgi:transcriptional regulator with XRE-family HTH domain
MSLKKSIGERIQLYRTVNGLTQYDFAKIADRSKQLVAAWEAGRAEITVSTVVILAIRLGICPRWLLRGDRELEQRNASAPAIVSLVPFLTSQQIVELASRTAEDGPRSLQMVSTLHAFPDSCVAMQCMDDAMVPSFARGDLLFLDTRVAPSPNSAVVAVVFRDGNNVLAEPKVVIRRLHGVGGLSHHRWPFRLVADAPGWSTIFIESEEVCKILGIIVGRQSRV